MAHRGLNAGVHAAEGRRGVVAAKHILAAEAGTEMLAQGGNAVDAAVATAFASGVVEPWMNGLGGVGYMVVQPAGGEPAEVVDYGPVAPRAAHAEMFEVVAGEPTGAFPWPPVRDDAHHQGWRSVVVPGTARGLGAALARYGRLDLKSVLGPAIRLARDGFPVSWNTTLRVALDMPQIVRYPETARIFLPNGAPPAPPTSEEFPPRLIIQRELADTLGRLAARGVDEMYTGETAQRIVSAMHQHGGVLTAEDLAAYQPRVMPAPGVEYRGWRVATNGGASGGTTLARILDRFGGSQAEAFGSAAYVDRLLHCFSDAFAARYAELGDLGTAPLPEPIGTSTTHLAAADRDGMVVSCTQTLLAAFGSRVTVPGTGVLLNDGMYWFDPRPGTANSVGPGKRPLNNMAPLVAVGPDGWPRLGIGSSGGRRIVSANVQMLLAMIDGGLPLREAIGAPRLDASGDRVLADARLPAELLEQVGARGWDVLQVEESPHPRHFASPAAVAAYPDGRRLGAADPLMPSGVAVIN